MGIFLKPAIGLDISDHSIESVLVVRKGVRLAVVSYGRITLPPGIIVDGFVEKKEEARQAIRKLLSDRMTPPLPKGMDRVIFALPESQVYSHIFQVPRIADDAALLQSLAREADGYFPYRHEEMAASYAVIAQRPDKKDVYYAAVHKDTLKGYVELFHAAGLVTVTIEGESASTARAIIGDADKNPVLIVDIGARVCNISVFDWNGIQFSEALATAGDSFTEALATGMGIESAEADSIKRNQGFAAVDARGKKALQERVDRLVVEALAALAYYEGKSNRQASRIVLCGGSTMMPGLVDYLKEKMRLPGRDILVEQVDPWKGIDIDPTLEKLDVRQRGILATTAIGLGMRGAGIRKFGDIDFLSGGLSYVMRSEQKVKDAASVASPSPAASSLRPKGVGPLERFKRLPVGLRLGTVAVGIAALATGAWFLASRRSEPATRVAAPAPASMDIEASALLGPVFDIEAGTVASNTLTTQVRLEQVVEREGTPTDGFAKGTIEIVNDSGISQTLVDKTRFLSELGILFRLSGRAVVPARGKTTATITADQPGGGGDVGPGRFTIPGLSPAVQKSVYGLTTAPMSGGLAFSGQPFTEDERATLLEKLRGEALAQAEDDLLGLAGKDQVALKETLKLGEPQLAGLPEIGLTVSSYRVTAAFPASMTAVRSIELLSLLEVALTEALPVGLDPVSYALDIGESLAVKDEQGTVVGIRTTASASLRP